MDAPAWNGEPTEPWPSSTQPKRDALDYDRFLAVSKERHAALHPNGCPFMCLHCVERLQRPSTGRLDDAGLSKE